jgi:hypothetical protein
MSVPRPRSSSRVPPAVAASPPSTVPTSEGSDEPVVSAAFAPDLNDEDVGGEEVTAAEICPEDVRDEERGPSVAPVLANASALLTPADETLRPSEVDLPDFRQGSPGRATFAALIGSAAALVVAGVAWNQFASAGEHSAGSVAPPVTEPRAAEQPQALRSPEPAPSPAAPVVIQAPSTPPAPLEAASGPSLEKTTTAVAVTVKTKRAPKRRPAPAPVRESDSPYDGEPQQDSNPATAPVPTPAPAPENAPQETPTSDVSPAESAPE